MPESDGGWDGGDEWGQSMSIPRTAAPRPTGPSRVERKGTTLGIQPEEPLHISSEVTRTFKVGEVIQDPGICVPVIGGVTVFSDGSVFVKVTVNWPEKDEKVRTTVYHNWELFKKEDPIYAHAMEVIEQVSGSSTAYITRVRGQKDQDKRDKWGAVKV